MHIISLFIITKSIKIHWKTIFYGIYYNPKNKINLSPNNNKLWELSIFSDSYWACDTQTRKSVSGWERFLNNCIISWGSRGQKTISQSSTEAEIVAQNEEVRDILFSKQVIEFLEINM